MTIRDREIPAYSIVALGGLWLLWSLHVAARKIRTWDEAATQAIQVATIDWPWWLVCAPSRLGDGWLYAAVVLWLRYTGRRAEAGHIAACVLVAWGGSALLKIITRRQRPRTGRVPLAWWREVHSSFPSQHAACVWAFGVAFALEYPHMPMTGTVLGFVCSAVAISRVAIGAHYLGDVLAGVALGVAAGVWG